MGEAFKIDRYNAAFASDPADMAKRIMEFSPASDSEALRLLRASFPNSPLSARVAALDFLMRRRPRPSAATAPDRPAARGRRRAALRPCRTA